MKKTVCLNMIVKNEGKVIKRCIDSIRHLIDHWVIVDTGSTDNTKEAIREHLKDLPGELYERPWVNFGYNRSEAMKLAEGKSDYLLFIDADDIIEFPPRFKLPALKADTYSIIQKESYGTVCREHFVYFLVRNNGTFRWEGAIHEYLKTDRLDFVREILPGVQNKYINDGDRSKDPEKCTRDIRLLTAALEQDPSDSRSAFYLARTYYSIRDHFPALQWFSKRVQMGGDPMEIYYSLLYSAICQKKLGFDPDEFLRTFATAHTFRPERHEAIYEIARYFAEQNNPLIAYSVLKVADQIPATADTLFVETWVREWGISLHLFNCAQKLNLREEMAVQLDYLLNKSSLPDTLKQEYQLERWRDLLKKAS